MSATPPVPMEFQLPGGWVPLELRQQQVYLSLRDVEDSRKRAVVELVLTRTPRQFGALAGDFGRLVRSVRPKTLDS